MTVPRVSIVIPIYGRIDLTVQCLRTLEATVDLTRDEVVVVDNGSTDRSAERIAAEFPWVRLVVNEVNRGFAGACNQGAAAALGSILVFLNNDTEALDGWLEPLVEALGPVDGDVGVVGSKLLYPDGTLQHAGVVLVDDRRASHDYLGALHRWIADPADRTGADVATDLAAVTGACLAVHRTVFEAAGGLDETYWNGFEDVELCLRVGAAGRRVRYEPRSVLVHHESQSGPERFRREDTNHALFSRRWRSSVAADIVVRADGAVFPGAATIGRPASLAPTAAGSPRRATAVRWRGPVFGLHPVMQLGRELAAGLHDAGCAIDTVAANLPERCDDPRIAALVAHALQPTVPAPAVTIEAPGLGGDWRAPADRSRWCAWSTWARGPWPPSRVATAARELDAVFVPSAWCRDQAVASGVPDHVVHVVPLGHDPAVFRPDGELHPAVPACRTRLLVVAEAGCADDRDRVLDAYRRAFTADDHVVLVWARVPAVPADEDVAGRRGLVEDAAAPGPPVHVVDGPFTTGQLAALLRSSTAVVHVRSDLGPLHDLVAAMATGCPVVAPAWGPVLDLCPPDAGWLVDARTVAGPATVDDGAMPTVAPSVDATALAAALRAVHDDPTEARRRGDNARRAVAGRTWAASVAAMDSVLREVSRTPLRRTDPLVDFHPHVVPAVLDDPRRLVLGVVVDTGDAWRTVVTEVVAALSADDDVTLAAVLDDEEQLPRLDTLTAGSGLDVLVVPTGGDTRAIAAALAACDAVLVGARGTTSAQAERLGKPVWRGLRARAIRQRVGEPALAVRPS